MCLQYLRSCCHGRHLQILKMTISIIQSIHNPSHKSSRSLLLLIPAERGPSGFEWREAGDQSERMLNVCTRCASPMCQMLKSVAQGQAMLHYTFQLKTQFQTEILPKRRGTHGTIHQQSSSRYYYGWSHSHLNKQEVFIHFYPLH